MSLKGNSARPLQSELSAGRAPWRRLRPRPRPRVDPFASGRKRAKQRGTTRGGASPVPMERAGAATGLGKTPGFLQTLQTERGAEAARAGPRVQEQDLRQWGLTGQWPRANFRPTGQLDGTVLSRAGTPRHERCWVPRVERPAGCFPADHRAFPSRPCGGAGRRGVLLPGVCSARVGRTQPEWDSEHPALAQGRGSLVRPCPKGKAFLGRSGGRPGVPGLGLQYLCWWVCRPGLGVSIVM